MDEYNIVSATTLSGWHWTQYHDGSGELNSPGGKSYFSYDLSTKEFQHPGIEGNNWRFFDGYPHNTIKFNDFKKFAEKWIIDNGLYKEANMKSDLSERFLMDINYPGYFEIQRDTETRLYFNPEAEKPFIVDTRTGWDGSNSVYCKSVEDVLSVSISSSSQPFEREVLNDLLNGSFVQNMQSATQNYKQATALIEKIQPLPDLVSQLSKLSTELENSQKKLTSAVMKADTMRKSVESFETKMNNRKPTWLQRNFPITKAVREKNAQADKDVLKLIKMRKTQLNLDDSVLRLSTDKDFLNSRYNQISNEIREISPAAEKLLELPITNKDTLYFKAVPICSNFARTPITHQQLEQAKVTSDRCLGKVQRINP
ncbi:hypothetical protein V6615_16370 (plasmid) [Oscillospiraceae bacterium PP1C4]